MPNPNQPQWTAIDEFLAGSLLAPDPVLDAALEASTAAGLPEIQVTPCQGQFLQLLAKLQGARSILEIGTLGGYSTIWLARGLPPGGRLVTLEVDPHHAEVARTNIARAGLSAIVDLRIGPALETLPKLACESLGPFDFIFIDADKPTTPDYFSWAVKLARQGSLIVVDNVIRKGTLLDDTKDPAVLGMRRFLELLAAEKGLTATAIQTVGSKGYDGFAIALVTEPPR
ncbi:MAG TPA: O-methyltransferase [Verrucomicrobiae bacterium]|nr:O-methyltransferase [Verrucomicrobiae bacterium]